MVLRRIAFLTVLFMFLAGSAFAVEVEGVQLPDTLKAGDTTLVFNGGGKRTKFGLKVYVAGLYLKQKSSDANAIINADEPMAIRLQVTSGLVTPDKMKAAIDEGFENSTGGNVAPLQAKIDAFTACFRNLAKDDVYDFIYEPGKGVEILKAGKPVSVIKGLDFKKGLFGIWLCDKPAQKSLKEDMLGK